MSQTEQGQPSASTRPSSRRPMELVGEQQLPDSSPTPPRTPSPIEQLMQANQPKTSQPANQQPPQSDVRFQQEYIHRTVWKAAVLGNLNALALVLGARLGVLVAVGGAIALAVIALGRQDSWTPIAALAVYLLGGFVPLVWLASRK